ncbi:NAD(P)H-hydrate dehydratase [Jatrophihabitans telluris]|uniref:Bifunctional NAD(P)H-hydrate repair enzyme n=2 Tax=Jatrophihabitans telluris TaxID=2038343 RepID=A0ABY4QYJ8_9ACTN|nr:NAD(P)H-hydrate dehydratase [Jatrophihabitans telluris]UQX87916.1 NAD(P)H-hydrate dehydratase [Jatrophihabitans telluris]
MAYSVEQIRAAERSVLAQVPDGALMAKAARAVATRALDLLGFGYGARAVLLVGAGDNGGDALYAGADLRRRGVSVEAVLAVPDRVHPAALAAFRACGGRVVELADVSRADVIIDGLVGIGASGPLRDNLVPVVRRAAELPAPVLAIDVPSGVDPDTGAVAGEAVHAAVTVCPGGLKPGLLVGEGRVRAGRVELVDIGLGPALADAQPALRRLTDRDLATMLPRPEPGDDKYTRGVVGVVAGSAEYPGAAQLAVGSARLGGVGAVRYAGYAYVEVSRAHPDVLVSDTVALAGRVQAWTIGPGLGRDDHARASLRAVLDSDVPVLIDADGLNLLAEDGALAQLLRERSAPSVLTPHDREFERLFGPIGTDRVAAARRAADRVGAVVLLKGFATVIAAPSSGPVFVNGTGTPELATAGSGDVLSGLIGSLLAAGLEPALAAAVGAHLHGRAGERAAQTGPVTAPDLLGELPGVIAELR